MQKKHAVQSYSATFGFRHGLDFEIVDLRSEIKSVLPLTRSGTDLIAPGLISQIANFRSHNPDKSKSQIANLRSHNRYKSISQIANLKISYSRSQIQRVDAKETCRTKLLSYLWFSTWPGL